MHNQNESFLIESERLLEVTIYCLIGLGALLDILVWCKRGAAETLFYLEMLTIVVFSFTPLALGDTEEARKTFAHSIMFAYVWLSCDPGPTILTGIATLLLIDFGIIPTIADHPWSMGLVIEKLTNFFMCLSMVSLVAVTILAIARLSDKNDQEAYD